jgi:hypothetical protein
MEYVRYTSDELTHFVGARLASNDERYGRLMEILRTGKLRASDGSRTTDDTAMLLSVLGNKKVSDGAAIQGVAVSFCDIPLKSLGLHMSKYKSFGIAFPKPFLVARGANPVFYVANDALLPGPRLVPTGSGTEELVHNISRAELVDRIHWEAMALSTRAHDLMFESGDEDLRKLFLRFLRLHVLQYETTLAFVKCFDSVQPENSLENYYMEREWRVYGDVLFDVSDVRRIILPRPYQDSFRRDCPCYRGELYPID